MRDFWACFLIGVALPAGAQVFTPEAYLKRALELAPEVHSAASAAEAARAQWKAALSDAWFPAFSASASANPWGANPLNANQWNSWRMNAVDLAYSAGINMNLFNSFYDWRRIATARLARESALAVLDQVKESISLNALTAYLDLFLKQKLKEVAEVDLDAQKDQYELTLDLYRHGMKSQSDLLKSETDWRSSELRRLAAESERRKSLYRFNVFIGQPAEAAAVIPELTQGPTNFLNVEEAVNRAERLRPELKKSANDLKNSELAVQQASQNFLPKLSASANYNETRTPSCGVPGVPSTSRPFYYLGLSLSLPVGYTGASQLQAYSAARATARQAVFDREALLRTVREGVHFSRVDLEQALNSYRIGVERERIAHDNLAIVLEQYRQGSADVIRLAQARADYLQAQTERLAFLHDTQLRWLQYRQAMGEPLWGP